jgi:pimeloyl-ACP methyl ester carboxylesterase
MTLDEWRAAGTTVDWNGHAIFRRVAGTPGREPALVCIHGFPTASWDWQGVWDGLRARFACVVAFDMLGFGFSAKPRPHAYSIVEQADLHDALLARLGVRRAHLLAHDYGDTVAQELLARDLERRTRGGDGLAVESACLLNGGLFPETHFPTPGQQMLAGLDGPAIARQLTEETFGAGLATVFGPRTQPSAAARRDFWRLVEAHDGLAVVHDLLGYMAERRTHRERWVGALQRTPVPLRVIDGPEDPVSGAHMAARYRELVPDPDVVELPGIGHYPQVEDPDGVARAFHAFHDRLGTPA